MVQTQLKKLGLEEAHADEYDAIVVGGGMTGANVLLYLASRGLRVILVEKGDIASGTSGMSTKLVHGGLRYLQQYQFGVTLESVRERQILSRLAPHMVWSLPFVIPMYANERWKNLKITAGLWIYDLMAGLPNPEFHKRISAAEVMQMCPGVRSDLLVGGLVYSDCRTDDARHTLEVIKAACAYGATALNYTRAKKFHKIDGRVREVDVVDALAGPDAPTVRLRGRVVINATGVWSERITELSGSTSKMGVVAAKGVHLMLSQKRLPISCAMILPSPHGDGRFCFAVPWYNVIIVGTTDTAYDGDIEHVRGKTEEFQYCLDAVNAMFPDANVTLADIQGKIAGLRPLVRAKNASGSTAALARSHHLEETAEGLIIIDGGKLTTARIMAEDTGDLVVKALLRQDPMRDIPRSRTDRIMLGGWNLSDNVPQRMLESEKVALWIGLTAETAKYLPTVYGAATSQVLMLAQAQKELRQLIAADHPYILAQVIYAVREEAARTIDDVLSRRIRLSITDKRAARAAADNVSRVMAEELRWSESKRLLELMAFAMSID